MLRLWRGRASLAALVVLASCGPAGGPALPPLGGSAQHTSCYVIKQDPQSVSATITFYGWPDN
ncbi:MAG TPA: hypothetical protein VGI19_05190, partial [Candidatus Cybelea sp.]